MKPQWNILVVCLLTLLVISPALIVVRVILQIYLDFIEAWYLLHSLEKDIN